MTRGGPRIAMPLTRRHFSADESPLRSLEFNSGHALFALLRRTWRSFPARDSVRMKLSPCSALAAWVRCTRHRYQRESPGAVKVLPTADSDRLARFQREAEVLAALSTVENRENGRLSLECVRYSKTNDLLPLSGSFSGDILGLLTGRLACFAPESESPGSG